jgi:ribonuclease HIII
MNTQSTQLELIRFFYHETSIDENLKIKEEVESNPLVSDQFDEYSDILNSLNNLKLEPSERVVKNLFAAAANW